jgi:hypothetical protein
MKNLGVLLAVLLCAAPAFAGDKGIIKLSLWGDKAIAAPNNINDVRGASFGIGSDVDSLYGYQWDIVYNNAKEVRGIKVAWFYETADVVWGEEGAIVSVNNRELKGVQTGLVNIARGEVVGAQLGIYNQVEDLHGLQLGIVNNAHHISKGLQVGIVNIAKNGWLPVMVLVNGRF